MIIRHFWKAFWWTILAGAIGVIVLFAPIRNMGNYLIVESNPQVSDVIIVPSGGGIERIEKALDLYGKGFAKKILVSGKSNDESSPSNAESMYAYALRQGVPADVLIQEPNAKNTWENLLFSRDALASETKSILIVTSAYHMKRVKWIAEKIFPDKQLSYVPVEVPFWDPKAWWKHRKGAWLTLSESAKIFLGKYLGIWYTG